MKDNLEGSSIAVSLIIPIYNTEQFIERCLRSVFEQTFENVEYILINDCTPDNSLEIAKQISAFYPNKNIKIIENEANLGSAGVRNVGIRVALGKYIIYIDSDDYVEPTMLEDMYNMTEEGNVDIVVADYYINYPQKQIYKKQVAPSTGAECARWILSGRLHSSNSNKLIKRELYLNNNISFIEGINMWEDMSTIARICYLANKVAYLPQAYFHYVQYNSNSYTTNITEKSLLDIQAVISILRDFFGQNNDYQQDLVFLTLKAKVDFIMHAKGDIRKKLCQLYNAPREMIIKHPSLSVFYKLLLLLEKHRLYGFIDIFIVLYFIAKKIALKVKK